MHHRLHELKDSEFDQYIDGPLAEDHPNFQLADTLSLEKQSNDPTKAFNVNPEDAVFTRSFKTNVRSYQISFEESFLDEHEEAFRKQAQKYMESALKVYDYSINGFYAFEIFNEGSIQSSFDLQANKFLQIQQKRQFSKDLETEDKLRKLFEFVFEITPENVAEELLYVGWLAWEKYLKIRKLNLSLEHILIESGNFVVQELEKLLGGARGIRLINLKEVSYNNLKSAEIVQDSFEEFLEFWCATIMLIGEEFFENPYSSSMGGKRSQSLRLEDYSMDFPSSYSSNGAPSKRSLPYS